MRLSITLMLSLALLAGCGYEDAAPNAELTSPVSSDADAEDGTEVREQSASDLPGETGGDNGESTVETDEDEENAEASSNDKEDFIESDTAGVNTEGGACHVRTFVKASVRALNGLNPGVLQNANPLAH